MRQFGCHRTESAKMSGIMRTFGSMSEFLRGIVEPKSIISISIIVLSTITTQPIYSQVDSTVTMYFPIGSGNLWQYQEPPPPSEPSIYEVRSGRDTTFMNGKNYRVLLRNNYGHSDTIGIEYKRLEGSKVFQYFPLLQIEAVIYDFSKNPGDTVSVFPRPGPFQTMDTSIVTILQEGTTTIFGKTKKYMAFYDKSIHTSNYWIDYVTDSLGITFSQSEPGFQLYLVGAIIDSTSYGIVTGITQQPRYAPDDFVIYQNYPNPFNPSTTVSFRLTLISTLRVSIWNVLGEQVRDLFEGTLSAGLHSITWNGQGNGNSVLPSGVYLYRVQTNQHAQTGKAILLR